MINTMQQLTSDFAEDINTQLEIKLNNCLEKNGFDFIDYNRVLLKTYPHFDLMNELWLDGVLILKWSKFSFKQHADKLIGSFEYLEV